MEIKIVIAPWGIVVVTDWKWASGNFKNVRYSCQIMCKFKVYNMSFDTFICFNMITTVVLANTSMSHNYSFFLVVRTIKI